MTWCEVRFVKWTLLILMYDGWRAEFPQLRGYSIIKSVLRFIVNSDSLGKSNGVFTVNKQQSHNMMSLLFVCVISSTILHITTKMLFVCRSYCFRCLSQIVLSLVHQHSSLKWHVVSETGFRQDSPNLNMDSDLLIECTLSLNPNRDFLWILMAGLTMNLDSIIEYPLHWLMFHSHVFVVTTARVLASQAEAIVGTGKHGHNIE